MRSYNPYTAYIYDVCRQERLTDEQHAELATKAREGDIQARNRIAAANLRLAIKFAVRHPCNRIEFADVVCLANLGLIEAAATHDPAKSKFSGWAWWYMRSRLNKALQKEGPSSCDLGAMEDVPDDQLPSTLDQETRQIVHDALDSMTPDYRDHLKWQFGIGQPNEYPVSLMDVAILKRVSISGVTSARNRAAHKLRQSNPKLAELIS